MTKVRITIEPNDPITDRSGKARDTGREYRIRRQTAYFHTGKAFPEPFEVSLLDADGRELPQYPAGEYVFAAESFRKGQRGLELDAYNIRLEPAHTRNADVKAA